MKKTQNLTNKKLHSYNSSGKPLPDNYSNKQESPDQYNYRGRSLDRKNSQNFSKTDKADQIVKTISMETITQDQAQNEVITQTITELVQTENLEINIIRTIDSEILLIIETGNTQKN